MLEKAGEVGFPGLTEKHRIGKTSRIGRKQTKEAGSAASTQAPLYILSIRRKWWY